MSELKTATVVCSILSAFGNGLDLSKGLDKKQKRRHRDQKTSEDLALQDALQRRPQEIRAEYDSHVARHGNRFEIGDSIAHADLARTLMALNTGLVSIINQALDDDLKTKSASKRLLLNLSQVAAADTLNALGELNARLVNSSQLLLPPMPFEMTVSKLDRKPSPDKEVSIPKKKRPPPSPLAARGAWVRSKSNPSGISMGPQTRSGTPKSKHQRSKSESVISKKPERKDFEMKRPESPSLPVASSSSSSSSSSSRQRSCSCQTTPSQFPRLSSLLEEPPQHVPRRQPSMLIVPIDFFESHSVPKPIHQKPVIPAPPSISEYTVVSRADPPALPTKPLHLRQNPLSRPRPASQATFLTVSTKIGEIPEHRWPDRQLTPEEQENTPMPYVIPPPLVMHASRKKNRGFRFWRREERKPTVVTC